jgi:hypothetical protein
MMPSSEWEIEMKAGAQEVSELASPCLSRGFINEMRTNSSANVLCSPDRLLWPVRPAVKKRGEARKYILLLFPPHNLAPDILAAF